MISQPPDRSPAARFLADLVKAAAPDSRARMLETHISWVFLRGRFAFKLKKPVKFDFLDFSTVELRGAACREELQLNRRLSPDVYLSVVPITATESGQLQLGGEGRVVDWVVKMKRLATEDTLEARMLTDNVHDHDVAVLGAKLAEFYVNQAPATIRCDTYRERFKNHIDANERDLGERLPSHANAIGRLHSAQRRYLRVHADELDSRVCDGRVVDGHGDLRPEHVYFAAKPVVIDCIEFNAEYRQNDIVDELGFLAMECHRRGADWIGNAVLQRYRETSGDYPPESLLAFYKCYRACVRAKVSAIRRQQATGEVRRQAEEECASYLQIAGHYLDRLGGPWLLIVGGMMGAGKTTLAESLAESLSAEQLHTDEVRRELQGAEKSDDGYGEGKYTLAKRMRVYEELLRRAAVGLEHNASVVLDGTFSSTESRAAAQACARRLQADLFYVECHCPREVALRRIAERRVQGQSLSEARPNLYDLQEAEYSRWDGDGVVIEVDTTRALADQSARVLRALRRKSLSASVVGS